MSANYLIVGGTRGIGLATARRLAPLGGRVITTSRKPPESSEFECLPFDATDADAELSLPDVLDGVVYCPGTITLKPFHRLDDAALLNDYEVNCLGAVRVLRQALGALKNSESASVVLFSTVAVCQGMPFHASIAAAKGAVEGLTRSLAAELAPKIRVNAIAPSLTDTDLAAGLLSSEEKRKAAEGRHPLRRVSSPEDMASLAAMLLSRDAAGITGQVLHPDNGLSSIQLFQ